jgi:hypothetical protein
MRLRRLEKGKEMNQNDLITQANVQTELYRKGMVEGQRFERQKFEAVIIAYDRALRDRSLNVPTYLHAALENARSEIQKQNIAAESGLRKDQRERLEGQAHHDLDTCGREMRAGS